MTNYELNRCCLCSRPATRYAVRKGKGYDCCWVHHKQIENGPQTLLNQEKESWLVSAAMFLGFLFFVAVMAVTIAGFISE